MEHTDGPPWKTTARFTTFEEADKKRKELLEDADIQVKVRWLRTAQTKTFAVRTRLDPAKAEIVPKTKKRTSKKRRKK